MIDGSLNRSLGQHARRLLEGGGGDERIGRERRLGDAKKQRTPGGWFAAFANDALVLLVETELVHLLFEQELRVAHVLNLHPAHHLAHNHFDVLVGNVDALEPVDFLDFVHQVRLELFLAEHSQNIVRIERPIHQRFARFDALAFLHVNVHAARNRVFLLGAVVGRHIKFALAF